MCWVRRYSSLGTSDKSMFPAMKSCMSDTTPGSVIWNSPSFGNIELNISSSESCSSKFWTITSLSKSMLESADALPLQCCHVVRIPFSWGGYFSVKFIVFFLIKLPSCLGIWLLQGFENKRGCPRATRQFKLFNTSATDQYAVIATSAEANNTEVYSFHPVNTYLTHQRNSLLPNPISRKEDAEVLLRYCTPHALFLISGYFLARTLFELSLWSKILRSYHTLGLAQLYFRWRLKILTLRFQERKFFAVNNPLA